MPTDSATPRMEAVARQFFGFCIISLLLLNNSCAFAQETTPDQARALALFEQRGIRVRFHENKPGKPVRFIDLDDIYLSIDSTEEIPKTMDEITKLLRRRHGLRDGQPDDFSIRDWTEVSKVMSSTSTLMTNLLLCIAPISLVVGGIGIGNRGTYDLGCFLEQKDVQFVAVCDIKEARRTAVKKIEGLLARVRQGDDFAMLRLVLLGALAGRSAGSCS